MQKYGAALQFDLPRPHAKEKNMAYKYSYDEQEVKFKPALLKTDRSMWKLAILTILTLGLYSIFFFIPFSFDLDKINPRRDGSKTINYLWAFLLSLFTASIVLIFWHHQIAERVSEALVKRHIDYEFGTHSFWGWYFFGSFIVIGPFIYFHKLCTAMNLLCDSYNSNPTISE